MRGPAWTDVPTPARLLAAQEALTDACRARIASAAQGGDEWKRARYGIASGSTAAKAAGMRGPAAQRAWLIDMVWPEYAGLDGFAARMAAVGTAGEPVAAAVYTLDRQRPGAHPAYTSRTVDVRTTGFCIHPSLPWLGSSPDLIIEEPVDARPEPTDPPLNAHHSHPPYVIEHAQGMLAFEMAAGMHTGVDDGEGASTWPPPPGTPTHIGTGEIKCIASKEKIFYSERKQYAKYGAPLEYYVQIQIEMEVLNAAWNDFIVHTPARTQVTRFYRNKAFFDTELLPALRRAYFELFLPQLQARADGRLTTPQTLAGETPSVSRLLADENIQDAADASAPRLAAPLPIDIRTYFAKRK
jgi:hypothetical protein